MSNGLTVLYEKRDLPLVAVSITNVFGSAYETSNIKGIAHFMEHLVFTGTQRRTHEDISREIEKKGGILNAFTTESVTSFWCKLPSEYLFVGLDILTDLLNNPLFKEDKFEKEKKVILEEIKMYHDAPQYHIYDKILENLYNGPFGEGVIGSEKTIKALKREFVKEYFHQHYGAENYIVTLVGKADFEKACAYLEKAFTKKPVNLKRIPIVKHNKETEEHRAGLDQAHFIFGMHAPLATDKRMHAFELLDAYLANGMSSRLFLTIREDRGLAYSVKGMLDAKKEYSYYTIYVGTTKKAIPEVKKLILEGFRDVRHMTEKDLQEAKERLIGLQKVNAEESVNVMNELVFTEIASKAEEYYRYEEKIKKITLQEVKDLAKISSFSTAAIVPR